MSEHPANIATSSTPKVFRVFGLLFILAMLALPAMSQNTKGDRPGNGERAGRQRESRFKNPFKKKNKTAQPPSYNRAQARGVTRASSARRISKPARTKVYPQKPGVVSNPNDKQRAWRGNSSGARVEVRSRSGRTNNVFPQYGRYVSNPSKKPKNTQRAVSNRSTLARLNKLQSSASPAPPGKKRKVIPRTASRSFIRNRSINIYANFPKPKQRTGGVTTKDLAGRKIRGKNYETPKLKNFRNPTANPYHARKRVERPYRGPAAGSYQSVTRGSQKAWTGDIAGRRIRGKNYSSQSNVGPGRPVFPPRRKHDRYRDRASGGFGGFRSASKPGEKRTGIRPNPVRAPGIGANGLGNFRGSLKGRRPFKGGGSVSGGTWNNKRNPIPVRGPGNGRVAAGFPGRLKRFGASPGFSDQGEGFTGVYRKGRPLKGGGSVSGKKWNNKQTPIPVRTPSNRAAGSVAYSGNLKGHRPLKGGGSVSGRLWNNRQSPVAVRIPSDGAARAGTFSGNLKGHRPLKGGGSVSGRLWNNRQTPVAVRTPSDRAARAGTFSGNIKGHRPLKGGGSVSGRLWNNKQTPIGVRTPTTAAARAGTFSGNIRAHRPEKGGGSVSGKLWNNKETHIPVRTPKSPGAAKIGGVPGKMKLLSPSNPGFSDQGEEFTGYIRRPRFWKDYIKNDRAAEGSLKKERPTSATWRTGGLQITVPQRKYVQNKNAAETATLKKAPTKATFQTGELQVRMKQHPYGKKPHAAENALPGNTPTRSAVKASEFSKAIKRNWDYIHNPNSAEEALKVREPGKAFGRSTDYQGNIRMKKFVLFEKNKRLHPDAKFVKINKNNVDSERDMLTNLKLWWARLFKKQETQPEHLKDKGKKPRYDNGEAGLWND